MGMHPSEDSDINVWRNMLQENSVRTKVPNVNLILLGDSDTGKETLLARLRAQSARPAKKIGNEEYKDAQAQFAEQNNALMRYVAIEKKDAELATDDTVATINAWTLSDFAFIDLLEVALFPGVMEQSVVAVAIDLSRPWLMKASLERWLSALEAKILEHMSLLDTRKQSELYESIKTHWLEYEERARQALPNEDQSASIEMISKKEFLEEGTLEKNLGLPLILIVTKTDLKAENPTQLDYIEYFLRKLAIRYGAAIFYTSAKADTNLDLLAQYVLHRVNKSQFSFEHEPQLQERDRIFIPAGYDSISLIEKSLTGSQARWPNDVKFEEVITAPVSANAIVMDGLAAGTNASDLRVEAHDAWVERLERSAGAGLEELQKQSVEASKKAEAAAGARKAATERRKLQEKDVSSKHLANFFNNLLSRPEKSKTARSSASDKKRLDSLKK